MIFKLYWDLEANKETLVGVEGIALDAHTEPQCEQLLFIVFHIDEVRREAILLFYCQ